MWRLPFAVLVLFLMMVGVGAVGAWLTPTPWFVGIPALAAAMALVFGVAIPLVNWVVGAYAREAEAHKASTVRLRASVDAARRNSHP
jgi:hypothetical protein